MYVSIDDIQVAFGKKKHGQTMVLLASHEVVLSAISWQKYFSG